MNSSDLFVAISPLLLCIVAVVEVQSATRVAVGLNILRNADVDGHMTHGDRPNGSDRTLGGNAVSSSGSCARKDLGLVEGDTNCDSTEGDTLPKHLAYTVRVTMTMTYHKRGDQFEQQILSIVVRAIQRQQDDFDDELEGSRFDEDTEDGHEIALFVRTVRSRAAVCLPDSVGHEASGQSGLHNSDGVEGGDPVEQPRVKHSRVWVLGRVQTAHGVAGDYAVLSIMPHPIRQNDSLILTISSTIGRAITFQFRPQRTYVR